MPSADTHETFALKVTKLLISRYTLGPTIYIGAKTEMDVHCQKHGWFTKKASLLRSTRTKYHCDNCLTDHLTDRSGDDTKSWIAKAEAVFTKNEYNFDNTIYVDSRTKVTYLCNRCGEPRTKIPATILNTKKGCPPCDAAELKKKTLESKKSQLMKELLDQWPAYVFDLTEFTAKHKNIAYICGQGHSRLGTPNTLVRGSGCRQCGIKKAAESSRTKKIPWVKEAKKIHGRKYSYHLVEETFTQKSLQSIVCLEEDHGPFLCRPTNHISLKRGCWRCAGKRKSRAGEKGKFRVSQDEFLDRIRTAHPHGLYDFSESKYYGIAEYTNFYCKLHMQECRVLPQNLWRGSGCYDCGQIAGNKSRALEYADFVSRCLESHEDTYDYSMVEYVNAKTPVIVGCYEHGSWSVLPNNHMYGRSRCPICARRDAGLRIAEANTKDTDWFISVAEELHNFKYDYSETEYRGSREKLWINCPESGHEPFEQWPRTHLTGKGCKKCGRESSAALLRLSSEEVIGRFVDVHRDRYDYSLSEIYGTDSYIKIGCPEKSHGVFNQKVASHLEGKGCPKCRLSKGETMVAKLLDAASIDFQVEFKIQDSVDDKILRFDFYIPNQNVLIEYDGEQHYRPVTFGGMTKEKALEVHKKIKSRDHRKNVWALDKGYRLIRIRFDENISTVLACEGVIKAKPPST